jgi:group I intron endonuclease
MYIYKFTHTETGRCYIGQTIQNPNQRRLEHFLDSRDASKNYHFHNALRKYGRDAFTFVVITEATSLEELNLLEEFYINQYNSIESGFNIRQGGNNKKHHPDSIKRMSDAQKAAHARRRKLGTDGGWTRKDGGPMKGKNAPKSINKKLD